MPSYASRKPIMIAETGSVETGGSKAAWIAQAKSWITSNPGVRAVVWFDTNQSASGTDWRLDSSATAFNAFLEMASDPAFGGRLI